MLKQVRIKKVVEENYRIKNFVLDEKIESIPGQFAMLWLPRLNERPMCIVNSDPLTFTVAKIGPFTEAVHRLKEGDPIWYRGPYGHGFEIKGKNVLLVGGGYGVAAMFDLARSATKKGLKPTLIIAAKTKKDIIYEYKLKKAKIKTMVATEDGSAGSESLATNAAEELIKSNTFDCIYSAGPEKMMVALGEIADKYKIPAQFSTERFMKCGGLLLCGHCEINGVLVCKDGPVFDWKTLKNLPDFGRYHRNQAAQKIPI
ncbi:MAG: dihydroorotate dehydrogenase electron transfer subunit [Candidatus Woykebacteria bacterium RBG_13_40_7b]|uniref:Dihydroorotate dehydrogenase electron transfer subunit n=1 Tax=Candidatus Woykebacteria bacterium RBG_13_40_7b TaxID=1802594 RepID=A0A1G1WAQ1_9BACT|nr:MAG: dihydroorotate dehydrogenase electron transfer subunit [Candidatus Woykebacteria bacterium RBG_13_40_7b]